MAVVGADFPNDRGPGRRFELNICRPGEPIELRPEPKNKADPRAIAVYSARGIQLGYLTAERAPWIGSMIANGRTITAVFQKHVTFGGWIRVAFDGATPVLPPDGGEDQDVDDGDGFWPDEIPPDD